MSDPCMGEAGCACHPASGLYPYSYPLVAANPAPALYSTSPYASAAAAAAQSCVSLGPNTSSLYSQNGSAYDFKDSGGPWRGAVYPAGYYAYDPMAYPYGGGYGAMPLSGTAHTKNATKEATGLLKSWLNDHMQNPYPTKGEKIMLAIITKMTLTQVSTWFANARRRLKKENKMTWSPRNRYDDDDRDNNDDDDKSDKEGDSEDKGSERGDKDHSRKSDSPGNDDRPHMCSPVRGHARSLSPHMSVVEPSPQSSSGEVDVTSSNLRADLMTSSSEQRHNSRVGYSPHITSGHHPGNGTSSSPLSENTIPSPSPLTAPPHLDPYDPLANASLLQNRSSRTGIATDLTISSSGPKSPRIWSLAETAASQSPSVILRTKALTAASMYHHPSFNMHQNLPQNLSSSVAASAVAAAAVGRQWPWSQSVFPNGTPY